MQLGGRLDEEEK
jgi:hypothetical protein